MSRAARPPGGPPPNRSYVREADERPSNERTPRRSAAAAVRGDPLPGDGARPSTRLAPCRVIKLGGRTQADPRLPAALAQVAARERLVIVHGGGDELSTLQRRLGITPVFRDGRRVTTSEDLELVRMVLSGSANKRLVSTLLAAGVRAVGISGEDGPTLHARALDAETFGAVGAPTRVETALLTSLLDAGWVPVVSPLARDESSSTGGALNVNGDDAAAAIAAALGATELLMVADVPGVLEGGAVVPTLDPDAVRRLIASGAASAGMIAKLEAAHAALAGGVPHVRIGDLASLSDRTRGTTVRSR